MNIVSAIKAVFAFKKVAGELKPVPKSGFLSSEFWAAILSDALLVAGVVSGFVAPNVAAIISAALKGVYMVVRLILKVKHVELGKIDGFDDLTEDQFVTLLTAFGKKSTTTTVTVTGATPAS
jgi:hypothetical protein